MLFMPWRDENVDLLCGYNTYEESYTENQQLIVPLRKQYENFNDVIEESKETQDVTKYDDDQDDIDDSNIMECLSMIDKYGFYDPDRDENLKTYDLATDIKQLKNRQHIKHDSYDPNVDSSGYNMSDEEYTNVMHSPNKQQYELCAHIMNQIDSNTKPLRIFIEGGGGVGKTVLGRAPCETINRYYNKRAGEDNTGRHVLVLAPTGMAAFHIKGNTFNTGLRIPPFQEKMEPLSMDLRNQLFSKYRDVKFIFIDEISMVGSCMFNKADIRLCQIFDCNKFFGGLNVIAIGDFYQMRPV